MDLDNVPKSEIYLLLYQLINLVNNKDTWKLQTIWQQYTTVEVGVPFLIQQKAR